MSKGITAFIIVLSFTFAVGILGGIGYSDAMLVNYQAPSDDASEARQALTKQNASAAGNSVFTDFTVGAANTLNGVAEMLTNTSGMIQVLFGAPPAIADRFQFFFRIVFGITFLFFIRGMRQ